MLSLTLALHADQHCLADLRTGRLERQTTSFLIYKFVDSSSLGVGGAYEARTRACVGASTSAVSQSGQLTHYVVPQRHPQRHSRCSEVQWLAFETCAVSVWPRRSFSMWWTVDLGRTSRTMRRPATSVSSPPAGMNGPRTGTRNLPTPPPPHIPTRPHSRYHTPPPP